MLIVEESHYTKYLINEDGTLDFFDSDGNGQEFSLECQLCGTKYQFDLELTEITCSTIFQTRIK